MAKEAILEKIKSKIRDIPDFPKKGIVFKDITPVLNDGETFRAAIDLFVERFGKAPIQKIVGIESRGFIFGSALAYRLGKGFSIIRKTGKLPYKTIHKEYDLEYGTDRLEMHEDSIAPGEKVLIIDDLLATGGTAAAAAHLVEALKGEVYSLAFLIELSFLNGRSKLTQYDVFSAIQFT